MGGSALATAWAHCLFVASNARGTVRTLRAVAALITVAKFPPFFCLGGKGYIFYSFVFFSFPLSLIISIVQLGRCMYHVIFISNFDDFKFSFCFVFYVCGYAEIPVLCFFSGKPKLKETFHFYFPCHVWGCGGDRGGGDVADAIERRRKEAHGKSLCVREKGDDQMKVKKAKKKKQHTSSRYANESFFSFLCVCECM